MKRMANCCKNPLWGVVLLLFLIPQGGLCANRSTLPISAAMSLKDAVTALKEVYEQQHPDIRLEVNFASSGALQKQIEQGAPTELFLSAGQKQMNALQSQDLIVPQSRCDLLGNSLVLIVAKEQKDRIWGFDDLAKDAEHFAIGYPDSVPVGRYAKQTLLSVGLWDTLQERLVFAKNARSVLAYVDSGNADAGLVYSSDTKVLKSAVVAAHAPEKSHAPIIYPVALIRDGKQPALTGQFLDFLKTAEACRIFARFGFTPLLAK
ncbi:molybdate ABC transporter substrate-binding protein [Syntrophotalea acetylenivorans]|uniref:Molybdate ABC transporter substrate-binding protein n=1 Tax=Syntrophotalea acetylenivorans TaxID=1842532 RepID=A0A1L3GKE7_9BACT|nr:molybdate ABC transporter substrate-binding protein [Syntrophotalea acetylenivorans]APG26394.1 molybdate ABC transporter substrate-binding protein [Syntrophotalea acetylenivorans]